MRRSPTPSSSTSNTEEKPDEVDLKLSLTKATPDTSPKLPKSSNPFHASGDFDKNPFSTSPPHYEPKKADMRHCISESNITQLKLELKHQRPLMELVTRSEEDLLISPVSDSSRHCVATPTTDDVVPLQEVDEICEEDDPLDYKVRRVTRSTDTSPTPQRKNTDNHVTQFRHRLEFLSPSGSVPLPSKVNMDSPELSNRKGRTNIELVSRFKSRKRAGTSQLKQHSSQWVSRYRPGVPVAILGESARESIMQAELRQREREFCDPKRLRYVL